MRHVGVSWAPSVLSRSSSWAPLGSPFPPRETLLAPFGRLLGLPFPLLRLSWFLLGASWLRLGASWLLLGGSWALPVSSWVPLGCFRAFQKPTKTNVFLTFSLFVCSFCLPSRSWGCLRHFGVSRAPSVLSLRSSWAPLGSPFPPPEALLAPLGRLLAPLGRLLAPSGWLLGASCLFLGASWLLSGLPKTYKNHCVFKIFTLCM